MKTTYHKPLLAMIVLSAAFAAPAFAQQMDQTQQDVQDAAVREQQQIQSQAAATPATGATTQQPQQSTAASSGQGQQGWNDLDTDKDGAISKAESSANPGLSQIFSQADGDGDGKLTQEEYKAFVVKNYGGDAGQSSGQ